MADVSISHYTTLLTDEKLIFRKNTPNEEDSVRGEIGIFDQEYVINISDDKIGKYLKSSYNRKLESDVDINSLYAVYDVSVNNRNDSVEHLNGDENEGWIYRIKEEVKNSEMYKIDFTISFPLIINSFYYFTFLFPTKNVKAELDYSLVSDDIDPRVITLLSSVGWKENLDKSEKDKIVVRYDGWVVPKSSILFVWYDKMLGDLYKKCDENLQGEEL